MPFRLSNPAWVAFQNDIDVSKLQLPPWGGVVQWGNEFVLVYICQQDGTLCRKGEVMLTDVSDRADLLKNIPRTYDAATGTWLYQIPAQFMTTLVNDARQVLETTGVVVQAVSEAVGQAAGGLTKPLVENLTIPLALAAVALVLLYGPKPSRAG